MSDDKKVICSNCGEEVPLARYCPKCGSMLDASPIQEVDDQLKRTKEIKKMLVAFKNETAKVLSSEINSVLDTLIQNISKIESKLNFQKNFLSEKEITKTICLYCNNEVKRTKFCSSCGKLLGAHINDEYRSIIEFITLTQSILVSLLRKVEAIISSEAYSNLYGLSNLLEQIKKRFQIKIEVTRKPVEPTIKRRPTKEIVGEPSAIQPEAEIALEKPDTFWTRLERNLLNYWFFYLAIILFSIGICLTIYYIVISIASESSQIAIIFSIGAGIVLIGQLLAILARVRAKKKSLKEDQKTKKQLVESSEEQGFLGQMSIVIMFIGSVVVFVGGVLGMASAISVPKGLFLYIGYAICILIILLGILNKSELIILTGIFEIIIYTSVDLLWGHSQAVLNGITSLIAFIVPIILVVLIAIFFKKWVSAIAVTTITSIMLCFPKISQNVGLEFIILMLIPIMMVLVIQFGPQNIHIPYKQTMAVLSIILPSITLIVLSFTNVFTASTEASWGKLYSYEIFLTSLSILAVAHYYPFIQEKHLNIDPKTRILKIFGQVIIGIVAIIAVALYRDSLSDSITTILFFLTYFTFGMISSFSFIEKEASIESSIISFFISEILAIVLLSIRRQADTMANEALLFIISVAFLLLAYISLIIPKAFIKTEALFITWFILSGINIILVGNITALNNWLVFVILLITILGSLVVNMPILIPKIKNWRTLSIIAIITNAIILSIYAFTKSYTAFSFEALVIFIVFMVVSFLSFFEWKKTKEVAIVE